MSDPAFVTIGWRRPKDLRPQDVIRLRPDWPWREILDVFHDEEKAGQAFGLPDGSLPEEIAEHVLQLETGEYTLLRLLIAEKCQGGEIADTWACLPNLELVQAQSRPAWAAGEEE